MTLLYCSHCTHTTYFTEEGHCTECGKSTSGLHHIKVVIGLPVKTKKLFTIEEIRAYITSQDSLGDVLYNLNADNIIKANITDDTTDKDER